jgi:hypothetical protein
MARLRLVSPAALAALALAACAAAASSGSGGPSRSPADVASQTPVATADIPAGAIVTIRVGDEEYRVLLTDPNAIATAEDVAAGRHDPLIPVGTVIRTDDGGVNSGYSWHIDPASFEWAEMTTELCDGRPSYVEDGTLGGDIFCPWSAEVVSVEPAS